MSVAAEEGEPLKVIYYKYYVWKSSQSLQKFPAGHLISRFFQLDRIFVSLYLEPHRLIAAESGPSWVDDPTLILYAK